MRAITFRHRDTGKRYTVACIQQVELFLLYRDPLNWMPVHVRKRHRWRQ